MRHYILDHEGIIRLTCFFGVLVAMVVWELGAPKRHLQVVRRRRWTGNLGIIALNTVLVRLVFPLLPSGVGVIAAEKGWGILNMLELPFWPSVVLSVAVLDLAIYAQHVLFHYLPPLWRLHRLHHADLDFDVTTGVRFHPIEILLSIVIKIAVVAALGAPAVAVVIFEVLLNATSMFNHGNVVLPAGVDRVLRWVVVTPDMHRVHHSAVRTETDSNFGFNLPWWDRIFDTYRAQPDAGHTGMTIGLPVFREENDLRLDQMLTQPFRPPSAGEPT